MKDQRKAPRKRLAVLLDVCSHASCKRLGKGFITNLSEGGMALETTERLREGEKFLLRFTLLNGWEFDLLGKIVHSRNSVFTRAYGVEFSKVNPEATAKIKNYIRARIEK